MSVFDILIKYMPAFLNGLTVTGNTNQANMFMNASPDTEFGRVYQERMAPFGEKAFVKNVREAIDSIMASSDPIAQFDDLEGVNTFQEAQSCQVEL